MQGVALDLVLMLYAERLFLSTILLKDQKGSNITSEFIIHNSAQYKKLLAQFPLNIR